MTAQPLTPAPVTVDGFARQPWSAIPVEQVMRTRVLTCRPDAGMRDLARMLVTHAVHAIVVVDDRRAAAGVVTGFGLARAARTTADATAADIADPLTPTVAVGATLEEAARQLVESGTGHVVVVDRDRVPLGMVSTIDIARMVAWGHA